MHTERERSFFNYCGIRLFAWSFPCYYRNDYFFPTLWLLLEACFFKHPLWFVYLFSFKSFHKTWTHFFLLFLKIKLYVPLSHSQDRKLMPMTFCSLDVKIWLLISWDKPSYWKVTKTRILLSPLSRKLVDCYSCISIFSSLFIWNRKCTSSLFLIFFLPLQWAIMANILAIKALFFIYPCLALIKVMIIGGKTLYFRTAPQKRASTDKFHPISGLKTIVFFHRNVLHASIHKSLFSSWINCILCI